MGVQQLDRTAQQPGVGQREIGGRMHIGIVVHDQHTPAAQSRCGGDT
jgi:hypothetical protein